MRVLLVRRDDHEQDTLELIAQAEARGVDIWRGGPGDLRRLSREQLAADERRVVALLGPPPTAAIDDLLARGGLCWLLHQIAYPSNVGFAVRTAEVSGADGVIVDAAFNHEQRARIDHVSMGASRLLPIVYHDTLDALDRARATGVQTVALEDVGAVAPWQIDLRKPTLCVLGAERSGLPAAVLERCQHSVRVPMAGFVPSYNVQAVLAMIASERLRQLGE
ncbi:MAG TPA: TrmH family RNA methyltransferase [Polyangiales bacterium]|nr:TrmH family RNA methyltransferase [Polyangiales bacterium]